MVTYSLDLSKCPKATPQKASPLKELFYTPEDFVDEARKVVVEQHSKLALITDIVKHADGRCKSTRLIAEIMMVLENGSK